ncbi:MAG: hypothetical protein AB7U82_00245 [Blastocatellales bacterium]
MKKTVLKSTLALIVLFGSATAGYAQAAQDTPESVAKAYFAAMQASDWAKCASYMHSDALASMKRTFGSVVSADKSSESARMIFGLKSGAEYSQLSEAAVFERLMSFIIGIVPDMKTALASSTNSILGRVDESPGLVHIVYRTRIKVGSAEVSEVELMSFRKQGATWRALLTSDMEEMFNKFAEGMAPASKEEEKNAPAGAGKSDRKP